jgi:protein phosphatase PTC1
MVYITELSNSKKCFVGNVGDSRAIICRNGKPIELTKDHRPDDPDERRRVRDAGKKIINNRISACLGVSRALGDKTFHPGVVSDPSTTYIQLSNETDEFMVIACDGLW